MSGARGGAGSRAPVGARASLPTRPGLSGARADTTASSSFRRSRCGERRPAGWWAAVTEHAAAAPTVRFGRLEQHHLLLGLSAAQTVCVGLALTLATAGLYAAGAAGLAVTLPISRAARDGRAGAPRRPPAGRLAAGRRALAAAPRRPADHVPDPPPAPTAGAVGGPGAARGRRAAEAAHRPHDRRRPGSRPARPHPHRGAAGGAGRLVPALRRPQPGPAGARAGAGCSPPSRPVRP